MATVTGYTAAKVDELMASAGTVSSTDISDSTAVGRSVLTAANATTARTAIGAGTSSFSGSYADLSGKPTIPAAGLPAGGSDGQVLTKTSGTDYETAWETPASGPGGTLTIDYVSITRSSSQSISNETVTAITWDTEGEDAAGYHSTSTNPDRLTVPAGRDGVFLVSACIRWDANATGVRSLILYKNGSTAVADVATPANTGGAVYTTASWSDVIRLAGGDFLSLSVWQNSGGALDARSDASFLRLARISDSNA